MDGLYVVWLVSVGIRMLILMHFYSRRHRLLIKILSANNAVLFALATMGFEGWFVLELLYRDSLECLFGGIYATISSNLFFIAALSRLRYFFKLYYRNYTPTLTQMKYYKVLCSKKMRALNFVALILNYTLTIVVVITNDIGLLNYRCLEQEEYIPIFLGIVLVGVFYSIQVTLLGHGLYIFFKKNGDSLGVKQMLIQISAVIGVCILGMVTCMILKFSAFPDLEMSYIWILAVISAFYLFIRSIVVTLVNDYLIAEQNFELIQGENAEAAKRQKIMEAFLKNGENATPLKAYMQRTLCIEIYNFFAEVQTFKAKFADGDDDHEIDAAAQQIYSLYLDPAVSEQEVCLPSKLSRSYAILFNNDAFVEGKQVQRSNSVVQGSIKHKLQVFDDAYSFVVDELYSICMHFVREDPTNRELWERFWSKHNELTTMVHERERRKTHMTSQASSSSLHISIQP